MQQSPHQTATRLTALVYASGAVACHDPTDARLDGACRQTYEFGNSGCFEVRGEVVGTSGQPLRDILVGPRPASSRAEFNADYAATDAMGRYRVRLSRMAGSPPASGLPDTLSVYIVAADPRSAGVGIPARVRDSVLAVVTVAPVGAVPTPSEVRITLAIP